MNCHLSILLLLSLFLSNASAQKNATTRKSAMGEVELVFIPMVGDKPLYLDSVYTNPSGEKYVLDKLSFFISDLGFSLATGLENPIVSTLSKNGVFLIRLEECNHDAGYGKQSIKLGFKVKAGAYSEIRFNVGVPRGLNHADPTAAAPPLDPGKSDMFWEWNSGYIFFIANGKLPQDSNQLLHFAIGGDSRVMPFSFGNLFNIKPVIEVKENKITRVNFTIDFNKIFINGDGSKYTFKSQDASIVHGGYYADVLRMNCLRSIEFKSCEEIDKK
jgi:hypothetical protein